MANFSLLPWVRGVWVYLLQNFRDLPSHEEREQLTDLLQSEPVHRRRFLEFCTHGRSLGNGVTDVTGRSRIRVTTGFAFRTWDLPSTFRTHPWVHSPPFPYDTQTSFDSSWVVQVRTPSHQLHSMPGSFVSDDSLSQPPRQNRMAFPLCSAYGCWSSLHHGLLRMCCLGFSLGARSGPG